MIEHLKIKYYIIILSSNYIMIKGLRKRPTYDEVAEIVENNVDIIKKYPDRRAITMRNHPYLTTLDGESFLNALNFTQENMIKGQQRDILIRTYALQTDDMSHLEIKAKHDVTTNTMPIETRDAFTVTSRSKLTPKERDIARYRNTGMNTEDLDRPPSPRALDFTRYQTPVRNRFEMFDMAAGDREIEVEEAIQQELDIIEQTQTRERERIRDVTQSMLRGVQSQSSAAAASVIEPLVLDFSDPVLSMDPMTVNKEGDQQKREASTPPTSTKKKKNKKTKSDLLEIGDNPLGSAKSSSADAAASSSSAAGAASSSSASGSQQGPIKKTIDKQHGVKKDSHTGKSYWNKQNIQYLYEQLQLDGMYFTTIEKKGKEEVYDPVLGKKIKKTGTKLTKNDLLELLYKSRNI